MAETSVQITRNNHEWILRLLAPATSKTQIASSVPVNADTAFLTKSTSAPIEKHEAVNQPIPQLEQVCGGGPSTISSPGLDREQSQQNLSHRICCTARGKKSKDLGRIERTGR